MINGFLCKDNTFFLFGDKNKVKNCTFVPTNKQQ